MGKTKESHSSVLYKRKIWFASNEAGTALAILRKGKLMVLFYEGSWKKVFNSIKMEEGDDTSCQETTGGSSRTCRDTHIKGCWKKVKNDEDKGAQ